MSSFTIADIEFDPMDAKSIQKAIERVQDIEEKLQPALDQLVKAMAEEGVKIAKATLLSFPKPAFDTGELYETIRMEENGGEATVAAGYEDGDGFYAAYVEFGTGLAGQVSANNPNMRDPRQNDTGTYHDGSWVYYNDRIGKFLTTYGMAGRPFMYRTLQELTEEAEFDGGRIVAEYLGQ